MIPDLQTITNQADRIRYFEYRSTVELARRLQGGKYFLPETISAAQYLAATATDQERKEIKKNMIGSMNIMKTYIGTPSDIAKLKYASLFAEHQAHLILSKYKPLEPDDETFRKKIRDLIELLKTPDFDSDESRVMVILLKEELQY